MASISPPPPPPLLANRYRLERRLAQGGMAEVWLATDQALSRQVAVKVLKPALAADPVVAERFRREAVAAAGLMHPNIVAVYDTVDEDGRQAVVMQYIAGKSLRELLDEKRRLTPEMTIRIGNAVAAALDTAHRAGLVHRDVKPGNIMLTPEGRVLLTDFGIAKAADGTDGDLTSDNVMMGTAKYLSPEQVRGRKLDGRADLYALGLVLYECLAGRVPFLGETDADTALARLQRDPTPLGRLRPTLPRGLVDLIHRLLARNPDDRPASGAAIQSALDRIAAGVDDPTISQTTPRLPTPARGTPATAGPPSPTRAEAPAGGAVALGDPLTPSPPGPRPPLRPVPPPREPTPSHGVDRHGRPSRQFQQRLGPSLVIVGILLVTALVIALVLWSTLSSGSGESAPPAATTASTAGGATPSTPTDAGARRIVRGGYHDYDPNGDDGEENPGLVPNLYDGSDSTAWTTSCYQDKFMGVKKGVGIVLDLAGSGPASVNVVFGAAPWNVELYVTDQPDIPSSLADWGAPVDKRFSSDQRTASLALGDRPATHALVLLRELAKSPNCSAKFPYQGSIGEIGLTPG